MKKNIWPLSIFSYAFLFIILVVGLLSLISWFGFQQMQVAQKELEQNNWHDAEGEFAAAIAKVLSELNSLAMELANWDEVHQQLANPIYYNYWREQRLNETGRLPSYILSAELYSAKGRALAQMHASPLPLALSSGHLEPYLVAALSGYDLFFFARIPSRTNGLSDVSGYFAFWVDLRQALLNLNQFHYLDARTLQLSAPHSQHRHLPLSQLEQVAQFQLRPNPATKVLQTVMETTVYRLAIAIAVLAALFYLMSAMLVGLPLRRLSTHIDRLKDSSGGLLLEKLQVGLPVAELNKVQNSLNDYQCELDAVHHSLEEFNKELWELAHLDPLTELFNRRAFEEDWQNLRVVTSGKQLELCFVLFDCNHFKAINDTYGHQVGDRVLIGVANCLRKSMRSGDRLYRLGGDEYAALLLDCSEHKAVQLARQCNLSIAQCDFAQFGIKEPVRISTGIAHVLTNDQDGLDMHRLQWQADVAMYSAKRPGHEAIVVYSEKLEGNKQALFSNWTTNAIYEAIQTGHGLEMHYQPIVQFPSGQTCYYEALVRIRHKETLILPSNIFPLVESRRLERELDDAVIQRISKDLAQHRIPKQTGVSINLSGPTVVQPDCIKLLDVLVPYLTHYKLVLEITETALITHLQQARKHLCQLRQKGFLIALDDFGSGYSSLRYLANMPVDLVKFDITLVQSLLQQQDQRQQTIIANLALTIAQAGYQLVAEGVEDKAGLQQLLQHPFHFGQGYLFGRPQAKPQMFYPSAPLQGKASA